MGWVWLWVRQVANQLVYRFHNLLLHFLNMHFSQSPIGQTNQKCARHHLATGGDSLAQTRLKKPMLVYAGQLFWMIPAEGPKTHDRNGDMYTIEGFRMKSYQANSANHHTCDCHVGFLFPQSTIGKHIKMSQNFSFSLHHKTKLQPKDNNISTHTHTRVKFKILL